MTGSSPRPLEKRPRRLYSPRWASGEGPSEMSKLAALESRATFAEPAERPCNVGVLIDEFVE
jgi:hypothetical protein